MFVFATIIYLIRVVTSNANAQMTSSDVKMALDFHNELRASVYPPASNMQRLDWSTSLQALAQRAANKCVFEHNYGGDYAGLGENLYMGGATIKDAIMLWYIERENYNYSSAKCGIEHGNGLYPAYALTCGHYLQVTSASASEIGFGKATCSRGNLVVCEYNTGYSKAPYLRGVPCSQCTTAASWCYQNLCLTSAQKQTLTNPENATCSLICKDCKIQKVVANKCICDKGPLGCGVCVELGTPCKHGNDTGSASSCRCTCESGYSGTYCEENEAEMRFGVQLRMADGMRSQSYYPIPTYKWGNVSTVLKVALAQVLNEYCNKVSNFVACCPGSSASAGKNGTNFLQAEDFVVNENYPKTDITGELVTSVSVKKNATDKFCQTESNSTEYISISEAGKPGTFLSVIEAGNGSFLSNATLACCGLRITVITWPTNSTPIWPAYAVGISGGSGSGSGGGGSGQTNSGTSDISNSQTDADNTGMIVGIAVAAVAAIVAAILIIIFIILPKVKSAGVSAYKKASEDNLTESTSSQISNSDSNLKEVDESDETNHPKKSPVLEFSFGQPVPDGSDPPTQVLPTPLSKPNGKFLPLVSD